jgi:hypothetical protein
MTDEPIYLLDFRNQRVVELDPAAEAGIKQPTHEAQAGRRPKNGVTFAALGSPADRKD